MTISRWSGRIAVVTGASAGIGAATAIELAKNDLITIGLARRVEKVEELKSNLPNDKQRNLHAIKCDVSIEAEVIRAFAEIEKRFGGVDVLINNAGIVPQTSLTNINNSDNVRQVIDTNVMGVVFCTREAVKMMRERKSEGHIIHINSIAGHYMSYHSESTTMGIYYASKYAVTALAEQHRHEFIKEKLNIKVTSLSPGGVKTEIMKANPGAIPLDIIEKMMEYAPMLESKDIADAIIYLLSTPPNVLITELTIRPMNETF
ncbi:hypothetical protein PVAND_000515 [Polypedilum vanderplanki]|uniref:Dehydrogenase n=1 Tax=Polypedilum vanderplanki TaxID=319348 RepID=A0A9J6BLI6_POLVA|nr:hypothetical protein PVAND_000515 [Polypedilum vanderplanki]